MVIKKMSNLFKKIIIPIIFFIHIVSVQSSEPGFDVWLNDFKIVSKKFGISEKTINMTFNNIKYLPKVIKYDRYQPEFYEDTLTYIKKRANKSKANKGEKLYSQNKKFINKVEKEFSVEKELLLSLMGIETNFGTYLGKMDILSSLATLSFDKRRSKFFTRELLTLLKLVDEGKVNIDILFGSWAGAVGNFQFMPSTIKNYALDYDQNNIIELKKFEDSFASAANYINKIGWKKNTPCFYKIKLKKNIPTKYLNKSAKKLLHKKKLNDFKKYIVNFNEIDTDGNLQVAIITPDGDIVENINSNLSPAYIVFDNYELILKWNRSLRFALAVCTLKDKIKNEI
ncbi:MAG: membrane-bound lytic murein transglycosylase B [Pelagibacterales bacterium]|nr:membrane-bound lytic murein transglycosylase B [Pelagibacterales bacterium]